MDWDTAKAELRKPLDLSAIKPPPQGKFGEYVDGLHVIREANRIFGEDGWSYNVTRLEMTHGQVFTLNGQNGPYDQYRCSFLCSVQVNVSGVIREGVAVGMGVSKPEAMGDAIDSAAKEAETDALKRALRTFGNTFGLALYEKDKSKREVGKPEMTDAGKPTEDEPKPEMTDAEKRDAMKKAISMAKTANELDKHWNSDRVKSGVATLPQPMQNELQKAYTDRMGELS